MRIGVLAAIVLAPALASAKPFENGTFKDGTFDVIRKSPGRVSSQAAPAGFTNVSRIIYLNPCLPSGCTVNPGFDDSRTDHSSIPNQQSHLAAYGWGTPHWNSLVQCVKNMYAPFNITVTDQDPGTTPHFEVMVGGNSTDVGIDGAGGVAPFIPCDGQLQDNVITFVFAAETDNLDFLCWAAAQETAHAFGLDHELLATDPMTYLSPPVAKPGFQNMAADCGESTPRQCWCGNSKQNSAQYLMDTFGPANLTPASLAITSPADGSWVRPGFTIKAEVTSQLGVTTSTLQVDGANVMTSQTGALTFTAPATLQGGDHMVGIQAHDAAARTFGGAITVHVTASCANGEACANDTACVGGYCVPNANTPGGLGATCTSNEGCITGTCATGDMQMICTGACGPDDSCPQGFSCLTAENGAGVCWPSSGDGGGCSASSSGGAIGALATFGVLGLVTLRRRRR